MLMKDVHQHEMPKLDGTPSKDDYPPPAPTTEPEWGTWEELLLAAAVDRHGTTDWDAVAVEVHGRTTSPLVPTPDNCRQRYHALRRRFAGDGDGDDAEIPWVEELRKIRVAELRREVRRCDVSIVSLQLKVKKLEEERERSLEEEEGEGRDGADPANGEGEVGTDGGDRDLAVSAAADDDAGGGDDERNGLDGDESDRENRSFNESNSTDLKEENPEVRAAAGQHHPRPANSLQQSGQADNAPKPRSRSASSDTVAGESRPASPPVKSPDPVRAAETGESAEFRGSAGGKESSDVQSSASLSRQRRQRKREFAGGASSGSGDDESPADKMACVKSQPLAGFLEIIRSHNLGSLFERRFAIQETKEYQLKIRQHVDLQMVSSKLQQGLYSDDHLLFFRDLLLLCANATVFFPPNSDEFAAAVGLRRIITREMGIAIRKSRLVAAPPPPLQPKSDPGDTLSSSPEKPTSSSKSKKFQAKAETEAVEMKEPDNLSENTAGEPLVFRKKRKERSATGLRGARSGRGRGATSSTAAASAKAVPPVTDKPERNASSSSVAKKRSAAGFLRRMKRNTPSGTLLDTLKASADARPSGGSGGGAETKKGGSHGGRRASAGKLTAATAAEQGIPATPKRSVGRPPKKAATQSSQGRGRREGVEAAAKQQARKRGRR